ncbi:hypothetical protein [Amycolatopsis sp. DSM 110486]|uniref:hypothetical protein n=1 Tax=Amycolatopsis sp. DSM 110486 TaxID=2865832 RepID=UPI001C698983|nr:hypothetical protein [Amycolatopsis sp. DSM 110486]QYN17493.1 hypothetical protein K1T34_32425 [Amycolatopsis sp. DSM 110486]
MTDTTTYYRTGKGSHRHANPHCANYRRSIFTGDITTIPANEVNDWAPCEACCTPEAMKAYQELKASAKAASDNVYCENKSAVRGSYNPRLLYPRGTCRDCGATKVSMTKTMNLRKHKRAA